MKTLITGATGFLGQYLWAHLKGLGDQGSLHCCALNRLENPSFSCETLDLTHLDQVKNLVQRLQPDRVYHLAGIAKVSQEIPFESYFSQNTIATQNLLEALSSLDKPVDFLLTSSVHVYGNQTGIINERSEPKPEQAYGFSKYLAEETLKSFVQKHPKLKGTVVRLYSCIGPNQPLGFVTSDVCSKIRFLKKSQGGTLEVGPTDGFRRFTDVRDVIKTFPILLSYPGHSRFEIFNVASPHNTQIGQMIQMLLEIEKLKVKVITKGTTANSFKGLNLDTSKMDQLIPGSAFRPLISSLKDILASSQG